MGMIYNGQEKKEFENKNVYTFLNFLEYSRRILEIRFSFESNRRRGAPCHSFCQSRQYFFRAIGGDAFGLKVATLHMELFERARVRPLVWGVAVGDTEN